MNLTNRQKDFYNSESGRQAKQELISMTQSTSFRTKPTFTSNTKDFPDNQMPFVDKHMRYLSLHPNLNANHYISNLRLITRIR